MAPNQNHLVRKIEATVDKSGSLQMIAHLLDYKQNFKRCSELKHPEHLLSINLDGSHIGVIF